MSTLHQTDGTTNGRHPVNTGHLVMGLAFLGLCGVWLAVQHDWVATDDVRWLLPLPWVFAGAAGLIALAVSGRRRTARPGPIAGGPTAGTTDTTDTTDTEEFR